MLSEKDARRAVYNIWKDMETLWLFVFENEDAAARFSLLDAWNCTNPEFEARYVRSFCKIMEGEKKIRSWSISNRDNKLLLDAIAHCQFLPVDILNDEIHIIPAPVGNVVKTPRVGGKSLAVG